ncbi:hypothetical protein DWU98_15725 [Dyella monticola]|uniref:Lysine-specific metallo-endopeptidase domain-containing protein n=1 Tax=Dyella monticola TaxID=1927958 RepID=A0A370WUW6_9GAMM|nr:hypothetical protein [Dyella monticola]RDS79890.1 hypothetical protein DWU98_15725 [Dyella monticola]
MDTRTLSSSSLVTTQIAHPPNNNTSLADTSTATPIQPASIEHGTPLHAFFKDESVQPLSTAERGRVVTALKTGIAWVKQAIAALSKPFSKETKELVSELIPGSLENPSDRKMLENQLSHTLDGMQTMLDRQASNVGSSAEMPGYNALTNRKTGQMHISSEYLSDASDGSLAATLVHEASHAYANTDDNWVVAPHTPSKWESFKSMFSSTAPPKFDRAAAPGKEQASYTAPNAMDNAYTVQYTTEVLAGRPYDSLE